MFTSRSQHRRYREEEGRATQRRPLVPKPRLILAGLCAAALLLSGCEPARAPEVSEPEFDSMPPPVLPDEPSGIQNSSRYLHGRLDGEIVTLYIEGPRGEQVRCNREDLPCSYLELKELYESGRPIPEELQLTRSELAELVSQLDAVSETLAGYRTLDEVCAAGYRIGSTQNSNMGVHMVHHGYMTDGVFDPRRPEILLFAMEGGEKLTKQELGDCVDGKWAGDPRMQIVGAAFMLPFEDFGENHPEAFAGRLDNWHIHFNVCEGESRDSVTTRERCEASGGRFIERVGWMAHAYTVPGFDNQMGVFANYNPTVWPRKDDGADSRAEPGDAAAARESVIANFRFESPIEVARGETITFRNADEVPHTVTEQTASESDRTFDSGELGANGTFSVSFDEPGNYAFFCKYHQFMMGTVIVK